MENSNFDFDLADFLYVYHLFVEYFIVFPISWLLYPGLGLYASWNITLLETVTEPSFFYWSKLFAAFLCGLCICPNG